MTLESQIQENGYDIDDNLTSDLNLVKKNKKNYCGWNNSE